MIELHVNGTTHAIDIEPETPLLWVLRDALGLTGTKYGCGIAQCGVCTVHLDGEPVKACVTHVANALGKRITTIEGLSATSSHPLQQAWIAEEVPQCGYCQSGQIMAAAGLAEEKPQTFRCRHRHRHERQSMPLRHLPAHPQGDPPRCRDWGQRGQAMKCTDTQRRTFLKASIALGGGLALGFTLPTLAREAQALTSVGFFTLLPPPCKMLNLVH